MKHNDERHINFERFNFFTIIWIDIFVDICMHRYIRISVILILKGFIP
jgi:hypothetical protein